MNTLKSAFIAVVMLVVLYGVYVMLTKKPVGPSPDASPLGAGGWNPPSVDFPGDQPPTLRPPEIAGLAQVPSMPPQVATPAPPAHGHGHEESPYSIPQEKSPYQNALPPVVDPDAIGRAMSGRSGVNDRGGSFAPLPAGTGGTEIAQSPAAGAYKTPPSTTYPSGAGRFDLPQDVPIVSPPDTTGFAMMWRGVQDQLAKRELVAALETLSLWYGGSDVPPEKQEMMLDLLDQLAGEVIYSPQHYLEEPHEVQPGEKLTDIGVQYQVPWQLLASINGIEDPTKLTPGTRLKVVRGPFDAKVNLGRKELTLMVGDRYAGRFAVDIGNDPAPMTGEYVVREKSPQRTFYDRESRAIPPGDPMNPYGPFWIGLGGQLGIHGAPEPLANSRRPSTGSIIVAPDDARDLYAILSEDSQVTIMR